MAPSAQNQPRHCSCKPHLAPCLSKSGDQTYCCLFCHADGRNHHIPQLSRQFDDKAVVVSIGGKATINEVLQVTPAGRMSRRTVTICCTQQTHQDVQMMSNLLRQRRVSSTACAAYTPALQHLLAAKPKALPQSGGEWYSCCLAAEVLMDMLSSLESLVQVFPMAQEVSEKKVVVR